MAYPQYPNTYKTSLKVGDKVIDIEIGKFSEQVSASVLATCGETMVHTTIALGRKVNLGYFPLSVEFAEKLNASGIIKGSRWVKRDGRPLDSSILKARVIDRTLRPLFPEGITNEVQIINTVFSFDGENDPDMLGLLAAGVGLAVSDIPFDGPVAGLRIGYNKETQEFMFNPTHTERDASDLDLIVSGTSDAIVMVEAGANEVVEDVLIDALEKAQNVCHDLSADIAKIAKEIGKDKVELLDEPDQEVEAVKTAVNKLIAAKFSKEVTAAVKKKALLQDPETATLTDAIVEKYNADQDEENQVDAKFVGGLLDKAMKMEARRQILEDGVRPDGRATDEIRQIWCEVDVFPRTHGSAMFKRGATQAVTVTTLGNPSLGQLIESIEGTDTRHYMHFYSMPPYASGEAGRFGFPKRREIGHGALAERALEPMIPSQEEFPYTIHVMSEIVSSNGSTSQASICGSTMSLMAAGVPIKRPVAGIAMGLMSDGKNFVVLSDIQGLEDHVGDMDFKVAGTTEGVTAIQMDIKLKGLPKEILVKALTQAREGRQHILDEMLKCIDTPRESLSEYAPKIEQVTIPGDRIGELIGPGGKNIKAMTEETGAEINIEEDEETGQGLVYISSPDQEKIDAAVTRITNMMRVVEIGDEFDGTVTRVENYGAFVEYLPGREGLCHVSKMSTEFVDDPSSLVSVGDQVHVRISEIKDDGKIGLSMLTAEQEAEAKSNSAGRPSFRGGRQGGRGGDRRDNRRGGGRNDRRGGDRRGGDRR